MGGLSLHTPRCALLAIVFVVGPAISSVVAGEIACSKTALEFGDAFAGWQLLVSEGGKDVTREARYESSNPAVARVNAGYVMPTGDGEARIRIQHENGKLEIPVRVTGIASSRPVDFRRDIVPLLSRLGCNAGGCHGKASGQNGFKLSLFGFDAAFDYDAIARKPAAGASFPAPRASLLLLKATGQVPHGGGRRMSPRQREYPALPPLDRGRHPGLGTRAPHVRKLRIMPGDRDSEAAAAQQLAVLAEYSDGSVRDVTRQAEYSSNLDVVASVDGDGLVATLDLTGEAAIMARYMGHVAVFRALVPHGEPLTRHPGLQAGQLHRRAGRWPSGRSSACVLRRWQTMPPSCAASRSTCAAGCRRRREVRAFLADTLADKRAKLIDRLLDSPGLSRLFRPALGQHPAQLEPGRLRAGGLRLPRLDQGHDRPQSALRRVRARHRGGGRRMAGRAGHQLVLADAATTSCTSRPPTRPRSSSACACSAPAATTIPTSAGARTITTAWPASSPGWAARASASRRPTYASGNVTTGEMNPLTGKPPEPKYLDGPELKFTPEEDPRHALVDWMAQPDNPFFARALVNRMWGHFLGRGLSSRVDDMRETNPPSNPELLDALAQDFVKHKFDVKHVIRTILNSRVYQLSSEPTTAQQATTGRTSPATTPGACSPRCSSTPSTSVRHAAAVSTASAQRPGRRPAARGLRLLLPRHLRPAAPRDRLRVRPLHRGDAGPGAAPGQLRRDRSKIGAGERPDCQVVEGEEAARRNHRGAVPDRLFAARRRPRN